MIFLYSFRKRNLSSSSIFVQKFPPPPKKNTLIDNKESQPSDSCLMFTLSVNISTIVQTRVVFVFRKQNHRRSVSNPQWVQTAQVRGARKFKAIPTRSCFGIAFARARARFVSIFFVFVRSRFRHHAQIVIRTTELSIPDAHNFPTKDQSVHRDHNLCVSGSVNGNAVSSERRVFHPSIFSVGLPSSSTYCRPEFRRLPLDV